MLLYDPTVLAIEIGGGTGIFAYEASTQSIRLAYCWIKEAFAHVCLRCACNGLLCAGVLV
jgi:hypothetical protein